MNLVCYWQPESVTEDGIAISGEHPGKSEQEH